MKTILPALFFLLLSIGAKAQQNYFVYIQTENKQPFYVKANDKLMSSSASGYVVIPKLSTGSYTITVGFPQDKWPQQSFPLIIGSADAGYLLKDFGTKGWGLFNIQTMEVAMAGTVSPEKTAGSGDDVFTNALSGAANPNMKTEVKLPVTAPAAEVKKDIPVQNPVSAPAVNGGIEKLSGTNDAEGKSMVYVDRGAGSADTIRVFVPADKTVATAAVPEKPQTDTTAKTTVLQKVGKFIDTQTKKVSDEFKKPAAKTDSVKAGYSAGEKPVVGFNSDCRVIAGDDDFLKLRKRMAAETGDEAMTAAAKKFFKLKCYSTEQIRNLSSLFLTDSGKYIFFDAAYPRVNDTQNFPELVSLLHDEYYVNRFKAMVRN